MKKIAAIFLLLTIVSCGPARHVHTVSIQNGEILPETAIRCPKCGSKHLSAGKRGYSVGQGVTGGLLLGPVGLIFGASGSNTSVFTCMDCGYTWQPTVRRIVIGNDSTDVRSSEQKFQDGIYK